MFVKSLASSVSAILTRDLHLQLRNRADDGAYATLRGSDVRATAQAASDTADLVKTLVFMHAHNNWFTKPFVPDVSSVADADLRKLLQDGIQRLVDLRHQTGEMDFEKVWAAFRKADPSFATLFVQAWQSGPLQELLQRQLTEQERAALSGVSATQGLFNRAQRIRNRSSSPLPFAASFALATVAANNLAYQAFEQQCLKGAFASAHGSSFEDGRDMTESDVKSHAFIWAERFLHDQIEAGATPSQAWAALKTDDPQMFQLYIGGRGEVLEDMKKYDRSAK